MLGDRRVGYRLGMPDEATPGGSAGPASGGTRGTLVVRARFCGPPTSANGGYISSRVASYADGTPGAGAAPPGIEPRPVATVLWAPVPLDTALTVTVDGERATLRLDDAVLAEAAPGAFAADPPEAVSYADALAAGERYAGYTKHPMPTCFGCGVDREPGDGLRLAIGDVGAGRVAGAWQPHRSLLAAGARGEEVATEFAWTALDCTAAWTWDFAGDPALLGTMSGVLTEAPNAGDWCVVVGTVVTREGRKIRTATALYGPDGRLLGRAESVWITVDPARFAP